MQRVAHAILGHPALYILSQRVLGADQVRLRCLEELDPRPGQRILDVGCGPAYYLSEVPRGVEYHGFDTDSGYIAWARQRFGNRGQFTCDTYTEAHRAELGRFDGILLMGLLHHLDDAQSDELLTLCGRSLAPGGKVVSLDTCFDSSLSRVESWLASQDRGQFVRPTSDFEAMARRHFDQVGGRLLDMRMPMRLWQMTFSEPRDAED